MKRRSKAGAKACKSTRQKAATLKRRRTPAKAVLGCNTAPPSNTTVTCSGSSSTPVVAVAGSTGVTINVVSGASLSASHIALPFRSNKTVANAPFMIEPNRAGLENDPVISEFGTKLTCGDVRYWSAVGV